MTRNLLEAILFVAEDPVPLAELAELLELSAEGVGSELAGLEAELRERRSGLVLREVAGGWRLYTHPDTFPYLERFASSATATRLSGAALETLAVVAYRQPVSRGQVTDIRGVDSESALHTLERRGLVAEVGRLSAPGTPVLYGTTPLFLEKLGLKSLDDLPPLADHIPPAEVMEAFEEPLR
ncbi:MAG: SMC-Scp complex subunit ScpB [Acidimicrobiia bacterium]